MDFNLTLIGQTIAMVVFVWFCMKKIWPPIINALEERRTQIADGLAAGDRAQADLIKAQEQAETIIAEARGQALEIVDQANKRGATLVDEARSEGRATREQQIAAGLTELEQNKNHVREELRGQVAAIAIQTAEKILQREIDASAHQDILGRLARDI